MAMPKLSIAMVAANTPFYLISTLNIKNEGKLPITIYQLLNYYALLK